MALEQRTILFSGNVQGVGFRYTACHVAGRYDVTGYVRNLDNGEVELVAEGQSAEIDAFIADLTGRMRAYVRRQTQQTGPYVGRYRSFGVEF